jgi:protein-S-isoprenylcysteine O-methyltransferase Ste14
MAAWALGFLVAYGLLALGLRTAVQLRRTGSSGFKGVSGRPGSAEWWAGVLFVIAVAGGVAAPVADLTGALEPISALDTDLLHAAGGGIFAGGFATTLLAQYSMGDSWRIGVDQGERTELVTGGPFATVRNPIFAGMILAWLGLALLVANAIALVALACMVAAIELQVRLVEEPYLLEAHGDAYRDYARRAGRFVPGVGRIR